MASVKKYTQDAVCPILRHNERSAATHSNADIDINRSNENYRLSPEHNCSDFDYFKNQLKNYQCMNRKDVIKMASWIITAPDDLPAEQEPAFFTACHDFLNTRYGIDNELQAIVHYDEVHSYVDKNTGTIKSSRPHLHYCFIPAQMDKNGNPRICAKKVINRTDLRNFHPDLHKFLNDRNISATVYSGVTKMQGGNIPINDLKRNDYQIDLACERSFTF